MNRALTTKELTKVYGNGKKALYNISLEFYFGQIVGLLGENGAGKSTLIHLLMGIIHPTEGNIIKYVSGSSEIAWVSQFSSIDWYLSVLDNVRLGARLGGYGFKQAEEISRSWLIKLGLEDKIHGTPDALSGGEQRRLQVARSLAQNPKILLLDEPTTGLDPIASKNLMKELKVFAERGTLVLISSHDMNLMRSSVDHVLFLSKGEAKINAPKNSLPDLSTLWNL